jgi:hypothetical protein
MLLLPLLFNFAQENQVGLKLSGANHHLAYADDVIVPADNIDAIKKKHRNSGWY